MENIIVDYFRTLFAVQTMRYSNADLPQLFPRLETSELGNLNCDINPQVIKDCLFSIGSFKALGPDGTFVELIAGCFSTTSIPDALNDTSITLVPKVASPSSVAQLRRISLCNTKYKVVIKIIVQKLRPLMQKVVSPAQASFIPGMQIVDNIIVAQKCIKSVRYQAILNGELTERFSPSAGIRQGDPLSPYIFVLCMEKLSHIINDHVSSGTWKSIKVARSGPAISHLFFVDDLILFGEASILQAKLMKH
ncbi:unnamed protein product [Prunus armeniaca]